MWYTLSTRQHIARKKHNDDGFHAVRDWVFNSWQFNELPVDQRSVIMDMVNASDAHLLFTSSNYIMKIKINPDGAFPELTKGEIREAALKHFSALGWNCWRNNNTSPTRRRTFIGKYGVPDIIGYLQYVGGEFLGVEVKTQGDRLSEAQKTFLIDLNKAGGFGYVAEDDKKGGVNYYLYLNDK
jgi:hypothetical protein